MEFLLLFLAPTGAPDPEPGSPEMQEMTAFSGSLADAGKLRRGAPLAGEKTRRRVRRLGGKSLVTDGPFAETKEVVGGFWMIDVADRAEAIDIAARTPHARDGVVEVHAVKVRRVEADSGRGKAFLLAFNLAPDFTDADGSKHTVMRAFGDGLARDGILVESARLADIPPPARVRTRRGKPFVIDGPFAETKEVVGGYAVVRAADQDAAVALAEQYPHATWGVIEVSEILFFDRT